MTKSSDGEISNVFKLKLFTFGNEGGRFWTVHAKERKVKSGRVGKK